MQGNGVVHGKQHRLLRIQRLRYAVRDDLLSPLNPRYSDFMGLNVRSIHSLLAELTGVVQVRLVVVKRTEYVTGLSGW